MKNTIIALATTAAVAVACNHEDAPPKAVTTTGAGVVANEDAVIRLTEARCARARACNNIGPKESYTDDAACKRENRHDLESELRPGECPRGIKEDKLSNCLQEIRNQKCGNPFDSISKSVSCRTGLMCLD